MKYSLAILLLLFLVSCSSTEQKEELDEEFDWLENSNFVPIKEIKYKSRTDVFDNQTSRIDALSRESIARLSEDRLEDVGEVDDPISKSISLCYRKEFDDAFEILDRSYFKYRKHPSYWNQVGTCYYLKGETRKAFLYYNKARALNSRYVPAINNHGVVYQFKKDDQKALAAYKKASQLNNFSMTPYFNLAQLYLKYGFIDKSMSLFKSLLKQNKSDTDAINGLATGFFLKGETKRAVDIWNTIRPEYYSRAYIGINYALALHFLGKKRSAFDILDRVDRSNLGIYQNYYDEVAKKIGSE